MSTMTKTLAAAAAIALAATLAACSPAADEAAPTPAPTKTTQAPAAPAAAAADPEEEAYNAEVAAWPDPLPDGYSWPAYADLPTYVGQLADAKNASGVYRCILIDAAWTAYFEDDDAAASKDYAARADALVVPDNPSFFPVMRDGVVIATDLAAASGICQAVLGDTES